MRSAVGRFLRSFEKRLVIAVSAIVVATLTLQILSQERASDLAEEGARLRQAVTTAEHSGQLLKLVVRFRLDASLAIGPTPDDVSRYEASLTDTAKDLESAFGALRLGAGALGMESQHRTAFNDIDKVINALTSTRGNPDPATEALLNTMLDVAARLNESAEQSRDRAVAKLESSAREWQSVVAVFVFVLMALALLIQLDISRNILPSLRRMHGSLRKLADGDLDIEIENFSLVELRDLSQSLETFRRNAAAVQDLAFTDSATGLPNRRAFVQRAPRLIEESRARRGQTAFVALVDVDRFKYVNDDYGHATGDRLVKLVGQRMCGVLGSEALIARIGGDEFAILAYGSREARAEDVSNALVEAVREPFDIDSFAIAVTVSLGYIEVPDDTFAIERLLNRADLALYASKRGGRNMSTGYSEKLSEEQNLDRTLEHDLARALGSGELRMVYQPIYLSESEAREIEALVRREHPELGAISPARFIPAAERSGAMPRLGAWIIERSLSDLSRWPGLSMSINLSPLQLQQEGFIAFMLEACRRNDIRPRRVILEVTETVSIERNTRALLTLELLRNAGFRIALDDFGTGYSSLCMMKTFRFDRLKLDRSLVTDIGKDDTSRAVFDAAVQLARQIGAEVVAEGVSEEALVETARLAGCTHLQGFHLSLPVEAQAINDIFAGTASPPEDQDRVPIVIAQAS
jgi:diguanylate cyclase (GGDEF)-like protein